VFGKLTGQRPTPRPMASGNACARIDYRTVEKKNETRRQKGRKIEKTTITIIIIRLQLFTYCVHTRKQWVRSDEIGLVRNTINKIFADDQDVIYERNERGAR